MPINPTADRRLMHACVASSRSVGTEGACDEHIPDQEETGSLNILLSFKLLTT